MWDDERLHLTDNDIMVLEAMCDTIPVAARILVCGELPLDGSLGEPNLVRLLATNGYLESEHDTGMLFTPTLFDTIRMTRWSREAWQIPDRKVFKEEADRLGVKHWSLDWNNFHETAIELNNLRWHYAVDGHRMTARELFYLNSCLVFGKARAFDCPPPTFFCSFSFRDVTLVELTEKQKEAADAAYRPQFKRLAVPEIEFLHCLSGEKK